MNAYILHSSPLTVVMGT